MAQPLFQAGVVWLWWDELDRAKDAFETLARRAREMGDDGSLPYILVLAAQVEAVRGDLALAADHARVGHELAEQVGQETLRGYLLALSAVVAADAGDVDAARGHAAEALRFAARTHGRPAEHFATAALGRLELSLGQAKEAVETLSPLVESTIPPPRFSIGSPRTRTPCSAHRPLPRRSAAAACSSRSKATSRAR
jgi:ATP/maltotriose-dependent transcriptional regulator MalT